MDGEWDWDPDITGDPSLDEFGYQGPRDPFARHRPASQTRAGQLRQERGAQRRTQRGQREAQRKKGKTQREKQQTEEARAQRHEEQVVRARWMLGVQPWQPLGPPVEADRGEIVKPSADRLTEAPPHGAYFERRRVRRWWAPWSTRMVWQQTGPWVVGQPPATGAVVTVSNVDQLPGEVHTLGEVGPNGTVVY